MTVAGGRSRTAACPNGAPPNQSVKLSPRTALMTHGCDAMPQSPPPAPLSTVSHTNALAAAGRRPPRLRALICFVCSLIFFVCSFVFALQQFGVCFSFRSSFGLSVTPPPPSAISLSRARALEVSVLVSLAVWATFCLLSRELLSFVPRTCTALPLLCCAVSVGSVLFGVCTFCCLSVCFACHCFSVLVF